MNARPCIAPVGVPAVSIGRWGQGWIPSVWIGTVLAAIPGGLVAQAPTFEAVVGHAFGERITQHHQMVAYLQRVAAASSRVTLVDQGASWEGRRLLLAVVTAPANHGRLAQIQTNARRLGAPRLTTDTEAEAIISNQPAVLWFGGSIHGNELSGSEGALKLLEHLATRDDPATVEALANTVVLIDPMLNPDGRDAFAQLVHQNLGRAPNPRREDWANDFTGWEALKYRTGHYYFDTNRDWFAQTQPETRLRVRTILAWRPQAITDMHEMGRDLEFFFYPGAEPTSPHVPPFAERWIARFADAYAAAFDSTGVRYVTRDLFDYFYPGYTDGYGSLQGAAGMLYEQGASAGLALERSDRTVRRFAEAVEHQYTAAWAAVRLAATERETLLRDYYQGLVAQVAAGDQGIRRYVIDAGGDPDRVAALVNTLVHGGVQLARMTTTTPLRNLRDRAGREVSPRPFPPGSYVVETAQPHRSLIQALLQPDTPLPSDFVAAARTRIDRGESAEIYDITAWSLPLLYDVAVYSTTDASRIDGELVTEPVVPAHLGVTGRATYAYLIDGRQTNAVAGLYALLADGHPAAVALKPTRIEGRDVAAGSVVVPVSPGDDRVHDAVIAVADRFGLTVRPAATGLSAPGFPTLGSGDVVSVRRPTVALVAEGPVRPYSFGWAWWTLDQQAQIPTTVLRTASVAGTRLDAFDVIVLPAAPAAAMATALTEDGVDRLRRWVRDGGTLVTLGAATELARTQLDLIALRSWYDEDDREDAQRFQVPGAILRGTLDSAYWLGAGQGDTEFPVLVNGDRIYLPPKGPPAAGRRVVGRYVMEDELRLAGHAWPESTERLGGTVFLYEEKVGRGRVIAFAEDPNFRGFWVGARRLFLNAVVIGPSAP